MIKKILRWFGFGKNKPNTIEDNYDFNELISRINEIHRVWDFEICKHEFPRVRELFNKLKDDPNIEFTKEQNSKIMGYFQIMEYIKRLVNLDGSKSNFSINCSQKELFDKLKDGGVKIEYDTPVNGGIDPLFSIMKQYIDISGETDKQREFCEKLAKKYLEKYLEKYEGQISEISTKEIKDISEKVFVELSDPLLTEDEICKIVYDNAFYGLLLNEGNNTEIYNKMED